MSATATKESRSSAADFRTELLDRLGLGPDANDQEIESAHRALTGFLEGAPASLSEWATDEGARADEAFALLTGPAESLRSAARERYAASVRARIASAPVVAAPAHSSRLPWYLLAAVAIVAIVVGVWWAGRPSVPDMTSAQSSPTSSAAPTLDAAKLAGLMQKIQADPKDVASLQQVSDLYFQVGDYKNAATFSQKVLDVDATNQAALLSLGAAQFNQGDPASAEKTWTNAASLYPQNQEVHYDLGFLYMTQKQTDKMKAEWDKVLAIDPNTDLAKTVSTHVGSVNSSSPSPSK